MGFLVWHRRLRPADELKPSVPMTMQWLRCASPTAFSALAYYGQECAGDPPADLFADLKAQLAILRWGWRDARSKYEMWSSPQT